MKKFLLPAIVLVLAVSAYADGNFFSLAETGTPVQVREAIRTGAQVNARDELGATPLMWAAAGNVNTEVITLLLKSGADANARDDYSLTPLIWAVMGSTDPKLITALLEAGADINAGTNSGMTPLMYAAWFNENPEMITLLLKAGADPKSRDSEGKTALDYIKKNPAVMGTDAYKALLDAVNR